MAQTGTNDTVETATAFLIELAHYTVGLPESEDLSNLL